MTREFIISSENEQKMEECESSAGSRPTGVRRML
jgi:hypothetical protein